MRPASVRDGYPFATDRASIMVWFMVIWSKEHRAYRDPWLTCWAWGARGAMLGLLALFLVVVLTGWAAAIAGVALAEEGLRGFDYRAPGGRDRRFVVRSRA
jgi:hypothetical protein